MVAACGTSGEPMKGDIMYPYGSSHPKMVVGSAGEDNVDCSTNLDNFVLIGGPIGTFVYFSVIATTPGTDTSATISAEQSSRNNTSINESSGTVTIDTIDTRVTGSLM